MSPALRVSGFGSKRTRRSSSEHSSLLLEPGFPEHYPPHLSDTLDLRSFSDLTESHTDGDEGTEKMAEGTEKMEDRDVFDLVAFNEKVLDGSRLEQFIFHQLLDKNMSSLEAKTHRFSYNSFKSEQSKVTHLTRIGGDRGEGNRGDCG